MPRIILLVDMDAFFAQIEERENPRFAGQPLVIGSDPKQGEGRGVVSTANYEARKYGIHSGMPISKAYQLCKKAVFLPVNFELYEKVSAEIMDIVKKYSPRWEIISIDEAYLDLSFLQDYQEAKSLAEKLKKEIWEKEKLTCTIGLGPNKIIAKMAAESSKPDGLRSIEPEEVENFLEPLAVRDLPGIGPKTAEKLRAIKVNKIGELRKIKPEILKKLFGKWGMAMHERAHGIDEGEVSSQEAIKSISKELTFEKDTRDPEILLKSLDRLCQEVCQQAISQNFSFKTITVVCRFSGFETHTKAKTRKSYGSNYEVLKSEATKLFLKFFLVNFKPIRLIGVRVSSLKKID